jgi:hypothetical protein
VATDRRHGPLDCLHSAPAEDTEPQPPPPPPAAAAESTAEQRLRITTALRHAALSGDASALQVSGGRHIRYDTIHVVLHTPSPRRQPRGHVHVVS